MLTKIVRFIVDILNNVFLNYTLVDLKVTLFKYIDLSLLIDTLRNEIRNFDEVLRGVEIKVKFRDEEIKFLKTSLYFDKRENKTRYISLSR